MDTHSSGYEAQLLIDDEIAELTARMQESLRNELAPASKLPDEILLHIFLMCRDLNVTHPKEWLQVTHVCRHWRYVAIGSPSLWTRLYNPPSGLTRLMLERSQNAPLDVCLQNCPKKAVSIETSTIILHEIERIQILKISRLRLPVLQIVHDVFEKLGGDRQASLLESLIVAIDAEFSPRPPSSVQLGPAVFRPTRVLRCLSVSGVDFDWSRLPSPSLTSLSHLSLYGECLHEIWGTRLMETLPHMHNLECLGFRWDSLNIRQFPPTLRPPSIHLPCLRQLKILGGHQADLESFLSCLTHPKLNTLSLYPSHPLIDMVAFSQSILSSVKRATFGPLEFLKLEFEDMTISANSWPSDLDGPHIYVYIQEKHVGGCDFVMDIMSCLTPFNGPDEIPLRHLYLDDWDIPVDQFIRVFASLPHLETIEVCHKLGLVLFKALEIALATDGASPSTPIPFSKLRSITWHGWYRYGPRYGDPFPGLSLIAFDALCKTLLSRRACGAALTRLELVECGLLEGIETSRLEEIGVEVIFKV